MTESHLDEELRTAVRGLGEVREPDGQASARAAQLDDRVLDLRGSRDRDPAARHPWRPS